ncbi:MAG: hypothetical protein MMC33_000970 [Icmadophila ericetorum]|nr:hypothetical protein [Icmadophila ericetorum]
MEDDINSRDYLNVSFIFLGENILEYFNLRYDYIDLGGIIVKQALVEAKLNQTYDSIRLVTYGIVFFATPHQGGEHVQLGVIAAAIAKSFLRNPDNTFLEALKKDSLFAQDLIDNFRHRLEDFYIVSFLETLPYKNHGFIVEKKSATLGLPGMRETTIAMAADHTSICKFESDQGDDYELVVYNIVKLSEQAVKALAERKRLEILNVPLITPSSESTDTIFMCPYTENPLFTGRKGLLDQIRLKLGHAAANKAARVRKYVALYGLAGVGKSQIAIAYVYWLRQHQPGVSIFWVHAATPAKFRQAYTEIMEKCKIPGSEDPKADGLDLVKKWLLDERHGQWLIVIDNADNTEEFFQTGKVECHGPELPTAEQMSHKLSFHVPNCAHGSVLVTTRTKEAAVKFASQGLIAIDTMSQKESVDLLSKAMEVGDYDQSHTDELASILGNLPLALSQAAAYIQENSLSIADYLEIYDKSEQSALPLLSQTFESEGRDPKLTNAVARTLMLSFDQIKKSIREQQRSCP